MICLSFLITPVTYRSAFLLVLLILGRLLGLIESLIDLLIDRIADSPLRSIHGCILSPIK